MFFGSTLAYYGARKLAPNSPLSQGHKPIIIIIILRSHRFWSAIWSGRAASPGMAHHAIGGGCESEREEKRHTISLVLLWRPHAQLALFWLSGAAAFIVLGGRDQHQFVLKIKDAWTVVVIN